MLLFEIYLIVDNEKKKIIFQRRAQLCVDLLGIFPMWKIQCII